MKNVTLLFVFLLLVHFTSATLLQSLHCEVKSSTNELTTSTPLGISIVYSDAQSAPKDATVSCGNDMEKNATCNYDSATQSGTCSAICTYEKGGLYQVNGRVSTGDCGSSKVEVLEVNEQNFADNSYLDFIADTTNAQVNLIKITSTPAIVKSDKWQEVNLTTRSRLEITSVKCSVQNNAKNACTCSITNSEKTRSQITCKFNAPLQSNYLVKFTTSDKKEKTFTVILNAGQAASVYAPQAGINLTVIGAILVVIVAIGATAFYFVKKLDAQASVKDELIAQRVKIVSEIDNLKKSNSRGETTDEDLELMLSQKNTELTQIEEEIKIEEAKLKEN